MDPKLLRLYSNIIDEASATPSGPKGVLPKEQHVVEAEAGILSDLGNRAANAWKPVTDAAGKATKSVTDFVNKNISSPDSRKALGARAEKNAVRGPDNKSFSDTQKDLRAKAVTNAYPVKLPVPTGGAPKPAVVPPVAGGVGASTQAQVDAANAQRAPAGSNTTTAGEQPKVAPPPPPAADVKTITPPPPAATVFGGRADAPKSPFAGPIEIIKPTASPTLGAPANGRPSSPPSAPSASIPVNVNTLDVRPGAKDFSTPAPYAAPKGGGPIVTTYGSAAPPMSTPAPYVAPAGGGPISTTNPSQPPPSMDLSPKDQSTLGNLPAGPGQISSGNGTLMSRSGPVRDGSNEKFTQGGFRLPEDAELEEDNELSELMRLSGRPMQEKAPPGAKAERQVKHVKAGYAKDGKLTDKEKSIAYATAWKAHNKSKVSESVMLEAGSALEHIIKKFKHETKNFLAGNDLDNDLYDALYDYYSDNGEIPYGVAKARDGDPIQWVSDRFADEMQMHGYGRQADMLNAPSGDHELTELARLAGLSESQVAECGDMGSMKQHDSMSVSTNMSSDGTRSVNISAQGDQADSLLQMLKMAGMRPHDNDHSMAMTEPEVIMVSSAPHDDMHNSMMHDEEMMDEEYANQPEQEYHSIDSILRQGDDLNREKAQHPVAGFTGDNPLVGEEVTLDEELQSLLDSILVREEMTDVLKAEQPYRDEKTGKMVTPPKGATQPPADSPFAPGDKRNVQTPKPSVKMKEQMPAAPVPGTGTPGAKPAVQGVMPATGQAAKPAAPAVKKPYTKANDPDFGNDW
jgi:hypothetical protein